MNQLFSVSIAVPALFIIYLILKSITKLEFCVICASIATTWVALLVLHYLGYFSDLIIVGILMGQSIVGVFYLLENKLPKQYSIFKLPFILTLSFFAYFSLNMPAKLLPFFILLSLLWLASLVIFLARKNEKIGEIAKQLIECCKKW